MSDMNAAELEHFLAEIVGNYNEIDVWIVIIEDWKWIKLFMINKGSLILIHMRIFNLHSFSKYVLSPFVCNDTLEI